MSDPLFDDLAHLLEDPQAVLNDLRETEVKLHSTSGDGAIGPQRDRLPGEGPIINFGMHMPAARPAGPPGIKLASLMKEQQATIKTFNDAGTDKRQAMFTNPADQIKLYSIIFAQYRPAPAFGLRHLLPSNALPARVAPGKETWDDVVKGLPIEVWARHTVRLDTAGNVHQGSGTLMADGRILTAAHVIQGPGFVFGNPPVQGATGVVAFNKVMGGTNVNLTASGFTPISTLDCHWINVPNNWPAALSGTEFAANVGLPFQTTPLTAAFLAGRKVVVIGHPAAPSTAADAALAPQVFTGAPFGTKRFMPGTLHPTNPIGTSNGVDYLRHDCSTLGGASGSCVVDLLTGVILGVHVSGKTSTELRNGAVPAWLIDVVPGQNLV